MSSSKRRWLIAMVIGLVISATLFAVSYALPRGDLLYSLYTPQSIGLWVTMIVRGVHSATETDFALIGVPINGFLYGLFIFAIAGVTTSCADGTKSRSINL